jgi:hypothetical protein
LDLSHADGLLASLRPRGCALPEQAAADATILRPTNMFLVCGEQNGVAMNAQMA